MARAGFEPGHKICDGRSFKTIDYRGSTVIHYELFFLYSAGFKPKDVIRNYGYNRGTAYRFHRIYKQAKRDVRYVIQTGIAPKEKQ